MTTSFAELLRSAVTEPGVISSAYRQFHSYSLGNQLFAWSQCIERGITAGPIATFMARKEKGRYVRKGEKALTLTGRVCGEPANERNRHPYRHRRGEIRRLADDIATGNGPGARWPKSGIRTESRRGARFGGNISWRPERRWPNGLARDPDGRGNCVCGDAHCNVHPRIPSVPHQSDRSAPL